MNKLYVLASIIMMFNSPLFAMEEKTIASTTVQEDENREELLIDALEKGNLERVKQTFNQVGANVNTLLRKKWTPIMVAAFKGDENIVQYLVKEKRANIHFADDGGATALMVAAQEGHLAVVKYLLEENKSNASSLINAVDKNGQTALYHATKKGNLDVVKYFAELSNFNPQIDGTAALSLAANEHHNAIVEYLTTIGISALPKQDTISGAKGIFYNTQVNNHLKLKYFDTIAYTSMPIAISQVIPSLSQGGTLHIYQMRVLAQEGPQEDCVQEKLELAVNTLGGTKEMHFNTSPIFGGSCSYHAIKNALVGLMLLHDYDVLAQEDAENGSEKMELAHFVSEDIKNLTTLKTAQFDCGDFMEKIHAKIVMVQHKPFLQKLEAINIQQGGDQDRDHIIRHEFDATLNTTMNQRHKNFQQQHNSSLSFVNDDTINYQEIYHHRRGHLTSIMHCFQYATLYQNEGMQLTDILDKIQNFDLASQIALFRTNINYRHAFILSLNTATLNGYYSSDCMHAITVILDKRGSIVNAIVFESNNVAKFAIKQILFDFINLFTDENIHMPEELRDELVECSVNPYGFEITDNQNQLPSFESLVHLYVQVKQTCDRDKKKDDVHKALFFLSKINHVYMTAKNRAQRGIDEEVFKQIEAVLAMHDDALHQENRENRLREEEVSLYTIL